MKILLSTLIVIGLFSCAKSKDHSDQIGYDETLQNCANEITAENSARYANIKIDASFLMAINLMQINQCMEYFGYKP